MCSRHFQRAAWAGVKYFDNTFMFNSSVNRSIPSPDTIGEMLAAVASKMRLGLLTRLEHFWFDSPYCNIRERSLWKTAWFLPVIEALRPFAPKLKSFGMACIELSRPEYYNLLLDIVSDLGPALERVCLAVAGNVISNSWILSLSDALLQKTNLYNLKLVKLDLMNLAPHKLAPELIQSFYERIFSSPVMQSAEHIYLPGVIAYKYNEWHLEALANFLRTRQLLAARDMPRLKTISIPTALANLIIQVSNSSLEFSSESWDHFVESKMAIYFFGLTPNQVEIQGRTLLSFTIDENKGTILPHAAKSLQNLRAALRGVSLARLLRLPTQSQIFQVISSLVPPEYDNFDLALGLTTQDRLSVINFLKAEYSLDRANFDQMMGWIFSDVKLARSILPRGPACLVALFTTWENVKNFEPAIAIIQRLIQFKDTFRALDPDPHAFMGEMMLFDFFDDPEQNRALAAAFHSLYY